YLERRDGPALTVFCYAGLLLAQVRYESVIYLLPIAILVLWVWATERRITLTWPVAIAPLLMIHYPLQHRIFDLRATAWELESRPGSGAPFSIGYVGENLSHALRFFFSRPSDHPSSLALSFLGWLAVPFFLLLVVKRLRRLGEQSPVNAATAVFAIGSVAQFVLLMCYFFGQFDNVIIRRLS